MVESVWEVILDCFGISKSPISCLFHQPFYKLLELGKVCAKFLKQTQNHWKKWFKSSKRILKTRGFLLVEAREYIEWSLKNSSSTDWAKSRYVNIHITRNRVLHPKPESVHWELIIPPFTRKILFFCNKTQILISMGLFHLLFYCGLQNWSDFLID